MGPQTPSYFCYYYFGRRVLLWCVAGICGVLAAFVLLAPHFLMDPEYQPHLGRLHCSGKGCGGALIIWLLIFLFLSLPVWIKFPSAMFSSIEPLMRMTCYAIWSLDKRPDFAIGHEGIYGIDKLVYRHIAWRDVTEVENTYLAGDSELTPVKLVFKTALVGTRSPFLLYLDKPDVQLKLIPLHGFDLLEILELTRAFAPDVPIRSTRLQQDL